MDTTIPALRAVFYCPMLAQLRRWIVVAARQAVKPPLYPVSARKSPFQQGTGASRTPAFLYNNNIDAG